MLASHNSLQKKDDKVGNRAANKEKRQRKKTEQGRKIEIDSQKKKQVQILAFHMKNKKTVQLHQINQKIHLFSCKTHF